MYEYLIIIIISILILFLIYTFYPKISNIIQKYIINNENVNQIKKEMRDLDNDIEEIPSPVENSKITEKISDILYLPIDFIYKLIITYGTPIFYNLSYKNI